MILLNMTLTNFCQFAGEPKTFEFGATLNEITADNNGGKTTIGQAIAFLLQGRDIDGSDKTDRLINDKLTGKRSMSVAGQVVDNDGQILEIVRSRDISATNSTTNKLFVNGEKYTQAKLDQLLGITDWRLFMAAVFPTWIHTAEDKVAAEVLRSLIKPVSADVVLKSLPTEQAEILTTVPKVKLADPSGYQSELRKEIKDTESAITKARGRLEVYEKTIAQPIPEPDPDAQPIETVQELIADLKKKIATSEAGQAKPVDTTMTKRTIERLRADYTRTKNSIKEIPPAPEFDETSVCDKCGQSLGLEAFAKVLESHEALVVQIQANNDHATAELHRIVGEARQQQEELTRIEQENAKIEADIDTLVLDGYKSELGGYEAQVYQIQDATRRRELLQLQVKEATDSRTKDLKYIADMESDIPKHKNEIEALGAYLVERERLTMDQIRQHLDKTDISLSKLVKETGELKPDFAITYDGQQYKGMSNSDRIRCGLEISSLINAVTSWALPVYIDNAESITDFIKPAGQYFTASVQIGAVLTVRPI